MSAQSSRLARVFQDAIPDRRRTVMRAAQTKRGAARPHPLFRLRCLAALRAAPRLLNRNHRRGTDVGTAENDHQGENATGQDNGPCRYAPAGFLHMFVHENPLSDPEPMMSIGGTNCAPCSDERDLTIWQRFRKVEF